LPEFGFDSSDRHLVLRGNETHIWSTLRGTSISSAEERHRVSATSQAARRFHGSAPCNVSEYLRVEYTDIAPAGHLRRPPHYERDRPSTLRATVLRHDTLLSKNTRHREETSRDCREADV